MRGIPRVLVTGGPLSRLQPQDTIVARLSCLGHCDLRMQPGTSRSAQEMGGRVSHESWANSWASPPNFQHTLAGHSRDIPRVRGSPFPSSRDSPVRSPNFLLSGSVRSLARASGVRLAWFHPGIALEAPSATGREVKRAGNWVRAGKTCALGDDGGRCDAC